MRQFRLQIGVGDTPSDKTIRRLFLSEYEKSWQELSQFSKQLHENTLDPAQCEAVETKARALAQQLRAKASTLQAENNLLGAMDCAKKAEEMDDIANLASQRIKAAEEEANVGKGFGYGSRAEAYPNWEPQTEGRSWRPGDQG